MPSTKNKKEVEYVDLKKEVITAIQDKYGNVNKFAYSDDGKKLAKELKIRPEYIKMYLTPKGATNFKFIQYLFKNLGLGNLEKKVEVVKTITYYKV